MSETAHEHINLPHPPLEKTPAAISSPSPPPQRPRRLARFVGAAFAWPHAVLRQPLRSLTIATLLLLIGTGSGVAGLWLWSSYHLRAGRSDLKRHHSAAALAHFQAYLRTWPNDPEALLLSARASWRLQEFDEAERYLKQYQQAAGFSEDFDRESFLLMTAQGEINKAAKYVQDLRQRQDAATPLILEALVSGCLRRNRLAEGAAFLQHWLELQPEDTQALFFQARLDRLQQSPQDAIAGYRRVLQLDPEHDSAKLHLAATLVETRQYQEAIPLLDSLRQRQPKNGQALILLAQCQDSLGQQDAAEQLLDQVLAQAPHHAAALAARGQLALHKGQLTAAETWLRQALAQEPSNYQTRYQLAECLLQQGRTEEVLLHEQRLKLLNALGQDPKSVPLRRALAEYYQQKAADTHKRR